MDQEENQISGNRFFDPEKPFNQKIAMAVSVVVLAMILYWIFLTGPINFPTNQIINITRGSSVSSITQNLYEKSVVKSPFLLKIWLKLFYGSKVVAGDYSFPEKENLFQLAIKLAHGDFGLEKYRLTFPEGTSAKEMSALLKRKLPAFNERKFLSLTSDLEGFLFPDTYFFLPTMTEEEIVKTMRDNFEQKMVPYKLETANSKFTEKEIIILASIIEEEARTMESRKMVSGILQNRLKEGMRLQVDAPFRYILGKTSAQLTKDDLAYNSPFNTYKYAGLPPSAITNPGLNSILAVLRPTVNSYLYFLTDNDGVMHYARTFEEHKKNKEKYLTQ